MTLAFYISGHGYGHAVRMAEVIRHLAALQPQLEISIRTTAPAHLFQHPTHPAEFDAGAIESPDTLSIDPAATLARLQSILAAKPAIVAREAAHLQSIRATALIADIPFLAGDIAHAARIPAIGISNFTWDWIYELFHPAVLPQIGESHSRFHTLLQLPFGQSTRLEAFPRVEPAPLIAKVSRRPPEETLAALGIPPTDARPRIFLGMRARLSPQALLTAADSLPGHLILHLQPDAPHHPNLLRATTNFQDTVAISSVILSKLGYGIVSECAATGTDLLYPLRTGFREDEIAAAQLPQHVRTQPLNPNDFLSGHWSEAIETLRCQPSPANPIPPTGAAHCAARILAIAAAAN
ncbi:MAG: hypothetical protein JST93_19870 [Acidobacteria bacterium]|nr:hypothetical protein [Acidobacteriota bacterium]